MKKLRKYIFILLAFIPVKINALTGSVNLTCDASSLAPSESTNCVLTGTSDVGISAYQGVIKFGEGLTITNFQVASGWQAFSNTTSISTNDLIDLGISGDTDPSGTFNILTFKATASATATGTQTITIDSNKLYDTSVSSTEVASTSAEIAVTGGSTPNTPGEDTSNRGLSDLTISGGGFTMKLFDAEDITNTGYSITLESASTQSFGINATPKNSNDSVVCKNGHTGDTLTCSNIAFTTSGGNSDMLVLVVVGSGDSAVTYTLSIIKPAQQNTSDNGIASIKIGDVTATKGSTGTYTITLKDVVEYTIEATLNDPTNYKFSDETLTYLKPYTFSNENGEDREIPLIVVPKDSSSGLASATYFLIVKQSNSSATPTPTPTPSGNNTNNNPQTGVGSTMMGIILIVSFIASIYLYKRNLNSYN